MAVKSTSRDWSIIRRAVKELLFWDNLLYKAKKSHEDAEKLFERRKLESEVIETKLKKYKKKKKSSSGAKKQKYVEFVQNFKAQLAEAQAAVQLARQEVDDLSEKLGLVRQKRARREQHANLRIEKFQPNGHVLVMGMADITSIAMMRDCEKKLHFALGKSVSDADAVSIRRAARKIGLSNLASNHLVYLDGTTFQALTVVESEARGLMA